MSPTTTRLTKRRCTSLLHRAALISFVLVGSAACGFAQPTSQDPSPGSEPAETVTTHAQTAPEQAAEQPRVREVTGWVVDAETGWPLARAAVLVESAPRAVRVNASGRFRLRAPARPFVVTVACPGYAPIQLPLHADQSRAVFRLVRTSSTRTAWPVTFLPPDL
ncbi:MAG: carboxypeptidase regulatory-like domain-containing protein [Bacteroidota bacterium]